MSAARGRTRRLLVRRREEGTWRRVPDELIVEEPLEVRLDGVVVATTMRTPGHDMELAAGLCLTDGLLGEAEVRRVRYCGTGSAVDTGFNVVTVETDGRHPEPRPRLTTTTAACGICGTDALHELRDRVRPLPADQPRPTPDVLAAVPDALGDQQALFARTGAVHAAAAVATDGTPLVVREDVGRHNAVDKVVGRLLLDGRLPASTQGLYVSGRASFEIVQKAWAAGFPAVVSVSAPTALAVETAALAGMTLVGFVRPGRWNLYAGG